MKIQKTLLKAILAGVSLAATQTACEKAPVEKISNTKCVKPDTLVVPTHENPPALPNCPACGMG
ncbi:MAG: hypothetical protein KGS48_07140 [Bacteroidetes bacterium]|nr:hypothetical protein [Bacteroidota bacterium]